MKDIFVVMMYLSIGTLCGLAVYEISRAIKKRNFNVEAVFFNALKSYKRKKKRNVFDVGCYKLQDKHDPWEHYYTYIISTKEALDGTVWIVFVGLGRAKRHIGNASIMTTESADQLWDKYAVERVENWEKTVPGLFLRMVNDALQAHNEPA